ncbi:MAG: DnaJ domain-containing protein [Amphritea sp.]|nr:DnaJ domain-containing protein [Amphritea sp.]
MNQITFILLGSIILGWYLWLRSKPQQQRQKANLMLLLGVTAATIFYLAVTGKLHWIGALLAVLLPFARKILPLLPIIGRLFRHYQSRQTSRPSAGNSSSVNSAILTMTLDHDSGGMNGTVTQGPLEGRSLDTLSEQEFIQLLSYCRSEDAQSARLLETYLDKRFGDSWREDDPGRPGSQQETVSEKDKAYEILGLNPGASREEIIEAHRRLMQKIHPDRGGSDYLAAEINRAKDTLLND